MKFGPIESSGKSSDIGIIPTPTLRDMGLPKTWRSAVTSRALPNPGKPNH